MGGRTRPGPGGKKKKKRESYLGSIFRFSGRLLLGRRMDPVKKASQ